VRRACCACHVPLDGKGAITEPSRVSHSYCTTCATNEHVKIHEVPQCGLEGPWGVCNLFHDHAGGCRRLED
jgi:hypothetical protein